jgi:hypothetical protein
MIRGVWMFGLLVGVHSVFLEKGIARSCGARLITFVFIHGDEMLQEAEVHIVFMRRAESSKSGGEMTAVPAATAMAWHFRTVLSGEKE